jgi:type III secretion protein V
MAKRTSPMRLNLMRPDLAFAGFLAAIVALLIVPLPTPLLDVLLALNISLAVVLLLAATYMAHPLRLSTFPTIILVATLFRLGLNVASTRLILGHGYAGEVIESFGEFVVGGNYVVGFVLFVIITVIQFVVIAKGSERVAEVAARFTLDAMPGRQMSIDADLRSGALTLADARRKRSDLQRESQLFGALDGAMKFVKGDAIAGIVIAVVNIAGGLAIGVLQRGMPVGEAARTYTLLTVGDGLVSQIPALIISVCAGLIVTRVSVADDEGGDIGTEVFAQLGATPRVFSVAAVLLLALAAIPGLPFVPFALIGASSAATAFWLTRRERERQRAEVDAPLEPTQAPGAGEPQLVPAVTPVTIELGAALAESVRRQAGEDALRREVQALREALFQRLGVRLPAVRIRFSAPEIGPSQLRVQVYEVVETVTELAHEKLLVLRDGAALSAAGIACEPVRNPLSGGPAALVAVEQGPELEKQGIEVLGAARQVVLFVAPVVQRCADRFVGLAEVQAALDQLEASHGALVDAVVPRPLSLTRFAGVLRRLVGEGVSIRDLRAILEALAEGADESHDVITLVEMARTGLARSIMAELAPGRVLRAVGVDPGVENAVRDCIRRDGGSPSLAMPPRVTEEILRAAEAAFGAAPGVNVVVCAQDVRRYMRQLLALERPRVVVAGLAEVHDGIRLQLDAVIRVGGAPQVR